MCGGYGIYEQNLICWFRKDQWQRSSFYDRRLSLTAFQVLDFFVFFNCMHVF